MNKKRTRARRREQWFAIAIVGILISTVIIGLVSAGSSGSLGATDTPDFSNTNPTAVAQAVEPAMQGITGASPLIHPTGMYQIFQPNPNTSNWGLDRETTEFTDTRAITIFRGNCSVIYNYVDYGINYETLQEVSDNVLTDVYNASEWALYQYRETDRTVGETFIITNYDLQRKETVENANDNCPEDYLGRQISWLDDGLFYAVRLVVRGADSQALDGLQDLILPSFVTYPNVIDLLINNPTTQSTWRVHPDPNSPIEQQWLAEGAFVVLPPDWGTNSGQSAFQTYDGFSTMDGYQITLRSYPNTPLDTIEGVEEWLGSLRRGIDVGSFESVENQRFGSGFLVSYTFQNTDGDTFSAVASVLNAEDGTLHVAELISNQGGMDLLAEPENDAVSTAQNIIRSFTVAAPQDYIYLP